MYLGLCKTANDCTSFLVNQTYFPLEGSGFITTGMLIRVTVLIMTSKEIWNFLCLLGSIALELKSNKILQCTGL